MPVRDRGRALRVLLLTSTACVAGVPPAAAEVVLDGSVNPAFKGALDGKPDYEIKAEFGKRVGGNLFHSFERFGLRTGESATFSGPDGIKNVISRVTGGERSDIDGALRSTIPGADFFFLNPAGVVFGPNATLDVQGSVHVSTADELRFEDGATFSARDPSASTFTVAPPEAFGFLGAEPAGITVDGGRLSVPARKALSLVGGDVTITAVNNGFGSEGKDGTVRAEAGRITLAALGGPGEVSPAAGEVAANAFADFRLTDQARVDASGDGGGKISIRAGQFVVENQSVIVAGNTGPADARGGIAIEAEAVVVGSGSAVVTGAYGSGNGGPLTLEAGEALVTDGGRIGSFAVAEGDAGPVTLAADDLVISHGSTVSSNAFAMFSGGGFITSSNNAGDITVAVADSLELENGVINTEAEAGGGGRILIQAGRLVDLYNSEITTRVAGDRTATAGNIAISAPFLILNDSAISAAADAGRGGAILFAVDHLFRTQLSLLATSSNFDGLVRTTGVSAESIPQEFLDASAQLRPSCAAGRSERASSFVSVGRGGVAPGPEDLLAGSYAGLLDAKTGMADGAEAPRFEPVGLVMACGDED